MSRPIIARTTAHESAHITTFDKEDDAHGFYFQKQNQDFQTQLFSHFNSWINSPNPNINYLKNYYQNHPEYNLEKGELLFDPFED